jgi:hypothetical protein
LRSLACVDRDGGPCPIAVIGSETKLLVSPKGSGQGGAGVAKLAVARPTAQRHPRCRLSQPAHRALAAAEILQLNLAQKIDCTRCVEV